MTQVADPIVVVHDASCLIDLQKARLLHLLVQLPYRLVIPLPIRASELLDFTPQEWAVLDGGGMTIVDLPPDSTGGCGPSGGVSGWPLVRRSIQKHQGGEPALCRAARRPRS